jgi:hypothetical protein
VARTSAVTVELGTIVEIHLTPRLNPGHDPGTNWRICLPEPIAIGGRLHASNRFLATFYHGVYPGSGLPNRCDRPVRQSPMVQDQKNVKQRRSLVEYDRTARVPTVPHGGTGSGKIRPALVETRAASTRRNFPICPRIGTGHPQCCSDHWTFQGFFS